MKQFQCFSLKMAGYLMQRGFVLFEVHNDVKSRRKIYIFKDSDEIRIAIDDYKRKKYI